jgi:protein SCO1/2
MPRRTRSPWRDGMHTYAILVVSLLGLVACPQRPPADPSALRGVTLPTPIERPAFRLQDTEGQPYDFADRTKGRLTFLFFGYTNCPDVCPVHMSNLATVLRALDYTQRQQVAVVFVTADPERDSPAVLRKWLDSFDPSFVGLWGSEAEVDSVQTLLGLAPAIRSPKNDDGTYAVGHAGQVIVFQADDTARVVYPFGTRQADWAHDLPLLFTTSTSPSSRSQ